MTSVKLTFKRLFLLSQLVFISAALISGVRAAGEIDPSFNGSAYVQPYWSVNTVVRQPSDGKILVGGYFAVANGLRRVGLARYNTDGSIDRSFAPNLSSTYVSVQAIAVQPDGKILVCGESFPSLCIRLNPDGSRDDSFQLVNTSSFPAVYDIALLPDGKIVVGGNFFVGNRRNIARLNADGTVDTTFNPTTNNRTIQDIEVQADGKIIGGLLLNSGGVFLRRYNTDGSEDTSYNVLLSNASDDGVGALKILPDGKLLVGGRFGFVNNTARPNLARVNADGTLDESFNAPQAPANIKDIELDSNGKILIARTDALTSVPPKPILRLEANGEIDSTFTFVTDPALPVHMGYKVVSQPDGKILLAGYKSSQTISGGAAVRVNPNGTIDQTFKPQTGTFGNVTKTVSQPDGKVLVAGGFQGLGDAERRTFGRLNFDGTPDTGFVPALTPDSSGSLQVYGIGLQPNGKIIVSGLMNGKMVRLNADGSLDSTFNSPGIETSEIVVMPDGKFLTGSGIRRFNPDGSADATFTPPTITGNYELVKRIIIQPDGKILISGNFTMINNSVRNSIARLNADGTLDTTFNPIGGVSSGNLSSIGLQADGKVILVGGFGSVNGASKNYIARLNTNGTLDTTFNPVVNSYISAVVIQPDNKIIIGGGFTTVNGETKNKIARLNADGTNDTNFQTGNAGTDGAVSAIALTSNGKVIAGGTFTVVNGVEKLAIARLLSDGAGRTRYDFDGDGKAEVSVFRPSSGFWYRLNSSTGAFGAVQFGSATDVIAPADYDGDGKTDVAVFRPGAFAYFYILDTSTNTFRYSQFGTTNDLPLVGDWDGDGKADLAVYREGSTGNFYYRPTSQPSIDYNTISLGTTGDKPLYGDFDGDGRLDAAVFRASSSSWIILKSSLNQLTTTTFGLSTDIPVPADYDGDGAANIAVFRPSNGTWYTNQNPATNYGAIVFGTSGDTPVPADYDGDGRADAAVFRSSTGAWYLQRTTQGFTGVAFGQSGDVPIPNGFIR